MTADVPQDQKERVADAISAYLRERPKAVDTPRGIRDWWLRHLDPPSDEATVIEALEHLEASGRVRRIVLADQSILWTAA